MTFWKLLPALALSAATILLLIGLAIVFVTEHDYRHARKEEVTVKARILAATVTAAVAFKDQVAAREYVNALAADPALQAVAVYDAEGSLFAGYLRPGAEDLPQHIGPDTSAHETNRIVVVAPVVQNGVLLGRVYTRALTEPLMMRVQRYSAIVLLAIMASLLLGVLGLAQGALARANTELATRATQLAAVNVTLEQQIAERTRVEETLRQAQKMEAIGQLTGGIAHDFNNLLQVILGNLDIAQRAVPSGDQGLNRRLEAAQAAGRRAAMLTGQLLAFARRQPLDPRPADVNRLVRGMSTLLGRTLGAAITIETILADGLWPVSADTHQLENALLNLAINSRDAMPGGGRLTIGTRNGLPAGIPVPERLREGEYVAIAVSDTGTGMAEEVAAKAFEPFFTTKEIGRGTGLGLSQVYGFVKQSGGHVEILSTPGQGTTVTIYLPRLPNQSLLPEPSAAPPEAGIEGRPALILLVEDDADVSANGAEMLRELGHTVITAANGQAALRRLDDEPGIGLLFTDVGLPGGLNGRQLAEEARRRRPGLPILFTTGYARDAIVGQGPLGSGIELIGKPFTYASLAGKLAQILRAPPA